MRRAADVIAVCRTALGKALNYPVRRAADVIAVCSTALGKALNYPVRRAADVIAVCRTALVDIRELSQRTETIHSDVVRSAAKPNVTNGTNESVFGMTGSTSQEFCASATQLAVRSLSRISATESGSPDLQRSRD